MKKWVITIVIIVVMIGGGSFFYVKNKHNTANATTAATQTTTVQKGNLTVKVSGSGTVASSSSKDVSAETGGTVDEVLVSEGDTVEKGDELVTFTDGSDPITAPNSGEVTSVDVSSGDKVQQGKTVAHITNYNKLQTTISVDETDINQVKEGQNAEITLSALDDQRFDGKVTDVAKEGTNSNGVSTFEVTLSITNPKNIKVGMSTEASITTNSVSNALYVPVDAVHINGSTKYVEVKNGGTIKQQTIKTGIHNDDYIQVTSGLSEGQEVVLPIVKNSSSSSSSAKEQQMRGGIMGGGMPGGGNSGGMGGNISKGGTQ